MSYCYGKLFLTPLNTTRIKLIALTPNIDQKNVERSWLKTLRSLMLQSPAEIRVQINLQQIKVNGASRKKWSERWVSPPHIDLFQSSLL